jgi:hypothetical protein
MTLQSSAAARQGPRRWWAAITGLVLAGLFAQAVLAGAMLSGFGWARAAHSAAATGLLALTLAAGLTALAILRRVLRGPRLGLTLLGLAAVILVQTALGHVAAKGVPLLWLHVPLGVALVGLAAQALAAARRLGEP